MNIGIFGADGEKRAARLLKNKGYKITEINYQTRFGEIDIIAENDEYIVFCEVKSRSGNSIAEPREFVGFSKQRKIITTAEIYLAQNVSEKQPRFDVIEVKKQGTKYEINHIENAFEV